MWTYTTVVKAENIGKQIKVNNIVETLCMRTRVSLCFFLMIFRCIVHRTRSKSSQLTAAAGGFSTAVTQSKSHI